MIYAGSLVFTPPADTPGGRCARVGLAVRRREGGGIGKGGTAAISVDGRQVAKGRIEKTVPVRISQEEGLDVGEDTGTPVDLSYDVPFKFSGKLDKVIIDLK
jgi:arylsulfatase